MPYGDCFSGSLNYDKIGGMTYNNITERLKEIVALNKNVLWVNEDCPIYTIDRKPRGEFKLNTANNNVVRCALGNHDMLLWNKNVECVFVSYHWTTISKIYGNNTSKIYGNNTVWLNSCNAFPYPETTKRLNSIAQDHGFSVYTKDFVRYLKCNKTGIAIEFSHSVFINDGKFVAKEQ